MQVQPVLVQPVLVLPVLVLPVLVLPVLVLPVLVLPVLVLPVLVQPVLVLPVLVPSVLGPLVLVPSVLVPSVLLRELPAPMVLAQFELVQVWLLVPKEQSVMVRGLIEVLDWWSLRQLLASLRKVGWVRSLALVTLRLALMALWLALPPWQELWLWAFCEGR